jgi:hypothetical protein
VVGKHLTHCSHSPQWEVYEIYGRYTGGIREIYISYLAHCGERRLRVVRRDALG